MFSWLENTPIAVWVSESLLAYPFMLSLHVVGLGVVVGIFSMRDMRLMGMFHGLDPAGFLQLGKLAWIGFFVNLVSGFFLFTAQAWSFVRSVPFLLKIAFVIVGIILAVMIQARLRAMSAGGVATADLAIDGTTKTLAAFSLLSWLGAIVTGRLIAYI